VERGETVGDFLDHAALVADADAIDQTARITLMTMHNAKGLEFPVVFIAGMEDGLFPHSRSLLSEAAMEEERRLCYVGMTRAEKRLILTWARLRRRFGGGDLERTKKSRFLAEIPSHLAISLGVDDSADAPHVDLTAERWQVRQGARRNLYTGKALNSVENVTQFFKERGIQTPQRSPVSAPPVPRPALKPPPARPPAPAAPPAVDERMPWDEPVAARTAPARPVQGGLFGAPSTTPVRSPAPPPASRLANPVPKRPAQTGTVVEHPKYGLGTVVRREGDGDDAKVTVIFQRHGMKKLVEKYAGLRKA
jgi:DNA helicase-2/ATP-dependent DNA helicase PcrA